MKAADCQQSLCIKAANLAVFCVMQASMLSACKESKSYVVVSITPLCLSEHIGKQLQHSPQSTLASCKSSGCNMHSTVGPAAACGWGLCKQFSSMLIAILVKQGDATSSGRLAEAQQFFKLQVC